MPKQPPAPRGPRDMNEVERAMPPRSLNALIERYLRKEIESLRIVNAREKKLTDHGRGYYLGRADAIRDLRSDVENLREDGLYEVTDHV